MQDSQTQVFHIQGMDCAGCAQTIENGVGQMAGVETSQLNFTTCKLFVTGTVAREAVTQRVRDLGYNVVESSASSLAAAPTQPGNFGRYLWQRWETRLILLGAFLMTPGLLEELLGQSHWLIDVASVAALLVAGGPVFRSAWRALTVTREITINVLMTIAALGAVAIGAYTEAGMVMVLFALGEALEGYTAARGRHAIRSLMEVAPQEAMLLARDQRLETRDQGLETGDQGLETRDQRLETRDQRLETGDQRVEDSIQRREDGAQVWDSHSQPITRNSQLATPNTQLATRLPIAALQPGDLILVRPGERIPMDGLVEAGISAVNQAAITGESLLVDKNAGDEVFAGSVNGEGALEIMVTRLAADNTISRMIRLVEEAQEKRAPVQRFVDRLARWYTPAVVGLALLVAALPPLLFGQPFFNPDENSFGWLYRSLALLIVACPCALVISTPVSIISAISNAARAGILFKGGAFLEVLSRVRAIALDKTGTLTLGAPTVVSVRSAACRENRGADLGFAAHAGQQSAESQSAPLHTLMYQKGADICSECEELLALAGALEQRSEHPLARAIVSETTRRGLDQRYPSAALVTALTGRGVTGRVNGKEVMVASHAYFEEQQITHALEHCTAAASAAARGHTPMLVSANGQYQGSITVADAVRPSSRQAVAQLTDAGLITVMLTGDNRATAQAIAEQVGVTTVKAELLPADKVAAVRSLQQEHGFVAMVGDGINDAPALAAANVGIAIGGATSTTQAMETADVTLMSDDLRRLPFAIALSRAAMRTVRLNVALSIGIKVAFLILVLLGWGTMWMAVLADMGTSLLVTLNGMRLLRYS